MEQIICDSSYLLKPTPFLEDFLTHSIFLRTGYLFNHSNCSHPSLEVVYLFLFFYGSHLFFEVYCIVFIRCTTCCHLMSLIVICCHSWSFVVSRRLSSSLVVPLVVTRCTTRLSFYKRSIFEIIFQEN